MEGNKNIKICGGCGLIKEKKEFRRGLPSCKECEENEVEHQKTCSNKEKCVSKPATKSSTLFRKKRGECVDCEHADGRNNQKATGRSKKWAEKNPVRMAELQHNFYENRKPEIRAKERLRMANDPNYNAVKNYRTSVSSFITEKTKTNKRLVINRIDYGSWLQYCFDFDKEENCADLDISNYGKDWQIDHVLPLNIFLNKVFGEMTFNETDNFEYLFIWFNTHPLPTKSNQSKNKYVDKTYIAKHFIMLKKFLKKNKDIKEKCHVTDNFIQYNKLIQLVLDNK